MINVRPRPLYPSWEKSRYPLNCDLGGGRRGWQSLFGRFGVEKNFLPLVPPPSQIEHPAVQTRIMLVHGCSIALIWNFVYLYTCLSWWLLFCSDLYNMSVLTSHPVFGRGLECRIISRMLVSFRARSDLMTCGFCRGADKSLARSGRKQARKNVRDARSFNKTETRAVIKFLFLQGKAPKEIHVILTETLACFLPGRGKD